MKKEHYSTGTSFGFPASKNGIAVKLPPTPEVKNRLYFDYCQKVNSLNDQFEKDWANSEKNQSEVEKQYNEDFAALENWYSNAHKNL